ncbi:MAG: outer membrane beta-barrel protein [Bacteroidales bacterium]|jgi:hypothetical protein|nr:outer membrane beta-barrel protein [Bacteroidales bacterium]
MKSGKIKFILLTIFVIFFAAESFAWKAKSDTTLYVSPWGGASYANIMGYTNPTYSFTDWSAGIDVEYKFTQEIALKSGISLINKGFKINNEYFDVLGGSIGEYPTTHQYRYLTIPFKGVYNFGKRKFNVWIAAGFNIGFLTKQHSFANLPSSSNGVDVNPFDFDNSAIYKNINLSFVAGLGVEYKLKPNIIVFSEITLDKGLTEILKLDSDYMLKHKGYYAGIGLKFGIPLIFSVAE